MMQEFYEDEARATLPRAFIEMCLETTEPHNFPGPPWKSML